MKKLKLKMQDFINPTILSHHEIKNIMGGSGNFNIVRCYGSSWDDLLGAFSTSVACDQFDYTSECRLRFPGTVQASCT